MGALNTGFICEETEAGVRFETHCLCPSIDPVSVYISRSLDGFRVTDGGGAVRSAMLHGKDEAALYGALRKAVARYSGVELDNGVLICKALSKEWLYSSILSIANASSLAANIAVDHASLVAETNLKAMIFKLLADVINPTEIGVGYEFTGSSGRVWPIDFAVTGQKRLLIKAITPHGNSVNANYTTFGDIGAADNIPRFSVYHPDRPLKPDDSALMRQVADLVPVTSLQAGARRELARI